MATMIFSPASSRQIIRRLNDGIYPDYRQIMIAELVKSGVIPDDELVNKDKQIEKMTITDFENNLEIGWDFAIEQIERKIKDTDVLLLCKIYHYGYGARDYVYTGDCDGGLCFAIREFAVNQIYKLLEEEK